MVTTLIASDFHAPNLHEEIFPGETFGFFIFGDANDFFAFDRLNLIQVVMTVVVSGVFLVGFRRPEIIPGKFQSTLEVLLDFVRIKIAHEILGKREGDRFLPVILTIFMAVLSFNLPSVIPGLNVSPNARIGGPAVFAFVAYVAMIWAGIKRYGVFKYFKSAVVVPNIPPVLHLLVVPIELFSTFVLRPLTLAVRLMANFLAGHLILVLLFSATNFFLWSLDATSLFAAGTLAFGFAFTCFEILVIVLQAYIFALLTAVYIELSLHADSH